LAIRLAFVLATKNHTLVGDEIEYDIQGRFIAAGKWFWSTAPSGIPHPSIWKAPGYPLFVGAGYAAMGSDPDRVFAAQTLLGPITIVLTWVLARRLFGPVVAVTAAAIVAVYPFAWQFEVRLFAESIATPLTLVFLILLLERPITAARAAGIGALFAAMVLIRPSAVYLLPGVAVAWLLAAGLRRGAALTGLAVLVACLLVAPWTIRNHHVSGDFVPISSQDQALYGVFNDDAANDRERPWGWRLRTTRDRDVISARRKLSDAELRRTLRDRAFDYIRAHPASVPKAFFWNGITRLWDVRRPHHILEEVTATGRSRTLTKIGMVMYYLLLPLAVLGLWFCRRRPALVLPLIAIALSASVVFTADAATRYRVPFEPVIVILAAFAARELVGRGYAWRARRPSPTIAA
jgi:4-amino-4-deoxy-L-arabinose transferase-like glycosyltransferase